jgi:N6-L-threonylcarbamoyladenine synthase
VLVNAIVQRALAAAGATLDDVQLVAATQGPGLVGALLVGLSTAKALAAARELPFAPVDHLQGHVAANFLGNGSVLEPPFVCLIVSGAHTLLVRVQERDRFEVLCRTLDDAAGEAFDKGARLLGLGYPGGAALERLASTGDAEAFAFPGSQRDRAGGGRGSTREAFAKGLDFSFAGLKTALLYTVRELSPDELAMRAPDLAASYQAAIVESLARRCERALEQTGLARLALGGEELCDYFVDEHALRERLESRR